jgi:hypothetical protein
MLNRACAARGTYWSLVSVVALSASESAAAPAAPIRLSFRLLRGSGMLNRACARATYGSSVSVALPLSASESAAAPASRISLPPRLQRRGQGCSTVRSGTLRPTTPTR